MSPTIKTLLKALATALPIALGCFAVYALLSCWAQIKSTVAGQTPPFEDWKHQAIRPTTIKFAIFIFGITCFNHYRKSRQPAE